MINNDIHEEASRITTEDIKSLDDTREKKGPLIVEFNSIKTKVKLLRIFKNSQSISLSNCLTKKALSLRKKAKELQKLGTIKSVWSYRGDIYYTLPGKTWRIRADWGKLNSLTKTKDPVSPVK